MRKQRIDAVEAVMPLFRDAKASTDTAAAGTAGCIAEMLQRRADANLPIDLGVSMLRMLTDALSAQITARELFIQAHRLAPGVIHDMGLTHAFGDEMPCPPTDASLKESVIPFRAAA